MLSLLLCPTIANVPSGRLINEFAVSKAVVPIFLTSLTSPFVEIFDKTISGEININLDFEEKIQKNIRNLIKNNLINSATDISLGGLIMGLIKSCEKNNLGVNIDKSIPNNWAGALFGEDQSRIIFSFDPKNEKLIKESLSNVDWEKIGLVSKENIKFENIFFESDDLFLRYNKGFSTDI